MSRASDAQYPRVGRTTRPIGLLNAHPELAGKEARDRALTQDSTAEQEVWALTG